MMRGSPVVSPSNRCPSEFAMSTTVTSYGTDMSFNVNVPSAAVTTGASPEAVTVKEAGLTLEQVRALGPEVMLPQGPGLKVTAG